MSWSSPVPLDPGSRKEYGLAFETGASSFDAGYANWQLRPYEVGVIGKIVQQHILPPPGLFRLRTAVVRTWPRSHGRSRCRTHEMSARDPALADGMCSDNESLVEHVIRLKVR